MAAYSDILPQPMQDLTNYTDDIPAYVANRNILVATRYVLEQDNTADWIVDMLSLTRYYRVNFKRRATVQKFLKHHYFLVENKENEVYNDEQVNVLHKIVRDLTDWVDKRKCEALDDSHWPVGDEYIMALRGIYDAFPHWKDTIFRRVEEWHERMLAIRDEIERETTPERGLSLKDIFDAHVRHLYGEVHHTTDVTTDTVMYTDGNLNTPPLQSDTDIEYIVV